MKTNFGANVMSSSLEWLCFEIQKKIVFCFPTETFVFPPPFFFILLDSNKLDSFKHYTAIFGQGLPGKYEKILACFEYVVSSRPSTTSLLEEMMY